jgi:hypothetical protein
MRQPWSSRNVMAVPEFDFALYRGKLSVSTATKLRSSSVHLGATKTRPTGKRACTQSNMLHNRTARRALYASNK